MVNQSLKHRIINKLKRIYIKSPINFSTITGLRYPGIPRLKGNLLLGRLTILFKKNGSLENIKQASKLAEKHPSGMCYFWVGKQLSLLITRPEDIQALKITHEQNLSRDIPLISKAAGECIATDNHEIWRQKRTACKKIMGPEALGQLKPKMEAIINDYIKSLVNYQNQPVELRILLFNMVVDIVTINLMGSAAINHVSTDKRSSIEKLTDLSYFLSETMHDVFQMHNIFKSMLPKLIRRLFFRNADDIETVKAKLQKKYEQLFLSANKDNIVTTKNLIKELWDINQPPDKNGSSYDNQYIKGEGIVLLLASVATTVVTLEFIIKQLVAHPEKTDKLRLEIENVTHGEEITLEAIKKMAYLDMIIKETLRLYPPAPILMPREISSYTEVNGIPLFKGDVPIFSPYVMHRSKQYWEQPDEFIPERFSKENQHNINLNAYFPFSIGPRFCPGQQFAIQEMKLILIALYRQYSIHIQNNSFEITLEHGGLAPAVPPIAYFSKLP